MKKSSIKSQTFTLNDEKPADEMKKAYKLAIDYYLYSKDFEEGSEMKPFYIGAVESVVVSFIKHPMDFFVQRFVQRDLLQKVITQLENVDCSPELFIRDIKKGALYAVHNEFDENWYRCRVGNLKKRGHKYVFTTFCIDYGYTILASVDRIRQLPPTLQGVSPLATNCSIFFETRLLWSPIMKTLMKKTIANKSLTLLVRKVSCSPYGFTDKYECDLTVDNKVDVGKVLMSHQCNSKSSLLNYENKEKKYVPNYKNKNEAMSSEDEGHNDGYNNYSRKSVYSNSVLLDRFLAKKREKNRSVTSVALSTPEHDGAAYNGREDLHGNSKAKTSSFNRKYETYNKQRYPGSQSMSTNYMGQYPKEEKGQELSSNHSYTQQQQDTGAFQAFVQNHQDLIKPFLHKTAHGDEGEMFTHSVPTVLKSRVNNYVTTPISENESVHYDRENINRNSFQRSRFNQRNQPKSSVQKQSDVNKTADKDVAFTNSMPAILQDRQRENRKPSHKTNQNQSHHSSRKVETEHVENKDSPDLIKTDQLCGTNKKESKIHKEEIDVVSCETNNSDLVAKKKDYCHIEVKLLSCQSPSLLYVSLKETVEIYEELSEDMEKFYRNNNRTYKDWAVGDRCAAKADTTWRRATVLDIYEDNASLFFVDFGVTDNVPYSKLRRLPYKFSNITDASMKCHLSKLMPSCGDWPLATKEYLHLIGETYPYAYMRKDGDVKDGSMPIVLWLYLGESVNQDEWCCVNQSIINEGLGVYDFL